MIDARGFGGSIVSTRSAAYVGGDRSENTLESSATTPSGKTTPIAANSSRSVSGRFWKRRRMPWWVALGTDGVVSVVSNEVPGPMSRLVHAALGGDFASARGLHYRLLPLMRANFVESNPVPVKAAMALLGHCSDRVRAPLGPAADATREVLRVALDRAGVAGAAR